VTTATRPRVATDARETVTVVIPAKDEARNIAWVLDALPPEVVAEGLSKAVVARYAGQRDGLASERTCATRSCPGAWPRAWPTRCCEATRRGRSARWRSLPGSRRPRRATSPASDG
jgi:hypothetical protein